MSGAARCAMLLLPLLAGCVASRATEQRLHAIASLAKASRDRGAYRCAPEELALAVAHLEFAQVELAQGDVARAREHLVIADANARAALRLSSEPGCAALSGHVPEACAPSLAHPRSASACPMLVRTEPCLRRTLPPPSESSVSCP